MFSQETNYLKIFPLLTNFHSIIFLKYVLLCGNDQYMSSSYTFLWWLDLAQEILSSVTAFQTQFVLLDLNFYTRLWLTKTKQNNPPNRDFMWICQRFSSILQHMFLGEKNFLMLSICVDMHTDLNQQLLYSSVIIFFLF